MVKFNIKKHHLIKEEFSFDLETVNVSTNVRRLRAIWSPELAQDVSAFHNIDAEAELTALLSEQIASEIDMEILDNLRNLWGGDILTEGDCRISVDTVEPTRNIKPHYFTRRKEFGGILPLARRVTATTIGMDLVTVIPMGLPNVTLTYLDFNYGDEPTVNDDGSWSQKNVFGSTFINFKMKPHIFIKKPFNVIDTPPNGRRIYR